MSAPKICPTCNVEYPESERFCPKDGTALRQSGARTDLVGSIIADRYHVLKHLGAGGMGRVYLAEHVKMGRQCAIKVLHPAMAGDSEAISRFNREAANASRIDHPNVAAIYDFGETHDGLLYLAMQYIEGETLTRIMAAEGALPPLRATDIVRQAAEGLYAAHALGIVHRDLKPDNIMVNAGADGVDSVKVVDFGIAKTTGETSQGVTRTGIVVGTPEYMSPEQLAGETVDGRSDLYSLALVAFNLLTGACTPCRGGDDADACPRQGTDACNLGACFGCGDQGRQFGTAVRVTRPHVSHRTSANTGHRRRARARDRRRDHRRQSRSPAPRARPHGSRPGDRRLPRRPARRCEGATARGKPGRA